jgi:hypothetical protein
MEELTTVNTRLDEVHIDVVTYWHVVRVHGVDQLYSMVHVSVLEDVSQHPFYNVLISVIQL